MDGERTLGTKLRGVQSRDRAGIADARDNYNCESGT
jgi:hypothetical protein